MKRAAKPVPWLDIVPTAMVCGIIVGNIVQASRQIAMEQRASIAEIAFAQYAFGPQNLFCLSGIDCRVKGAKP